MFALRDLYEKKKKLSQFQLFKTMTDKALWMLAEKANKIFTRRNITIYTMLDIVQHGYFIVKGEIEIEKKQFCQRDVNLNNTFNNGYRNGIVIKSYHNQKHHNQDRKIVTQSESFGVDQKIIDDFDKKILKRKQNARTRTSMVMYKIDIKHIIAAIKISENRAEIHNTILDDLIKEQQYQVHLVSLHKQLEQQSLPKSRIEERRCEDNETINRSRDYRQKTIKTSFEYYEQKRRQNFIVKTKTLRHQNQNSFNNTLDDSRSGRKKASIDPSILKIQPKPLIKKRIL